MRSRVRHYDDARAFAYMLPYRSENVEKLSTIALVLGGTSLVVSGVTAALMTIAYSGRIVDLESRLEAMQGTLSRTGLVVTDTFNRVTELDVGLTSLARVAKVDPLELSKGIAQEKARLKSEGAVQQSVKTEAPVSKTGEQQPTTLVEPVVGIGQAAHPATELAPSVIDAIPALFANAVASHDLDNPFVAAGAGPDAKEKVEAKPLAITVKPAVATVEMVDTVLAKRISANWKKPVGKLEGLSVTLEINVGRVGNVAKVNVLKTSGNKAFDQSALAAIKAIDRIEEVSMLTEEDYLSAYASRAILFTPDLAN